MEETLNAEKGSANPNDSKTWEHVQGRYIILQTVKINIL